MSRDQKMCVIRHIRDNPADRAGRLAGRVRAEFAFVGRQSRVDRADGRPGLHADPESVVEYLDVAEVATGVNQDPRGRGLAAQACATRSEGEQVVGCVVGAAETIRWPRMDLARHCALEGGEQRRFDVRKPRRHPEPGHSQCGASATHGRPCVRWIPAGSRGRRRCRHP